MYSWRIVPKSEIDPDRWDTCTRAHNREIFSEYWYWNAVCSEWQAWVKGDYEDVLAIPIKRKWGIIPVMRTPLYVKWLEGDRIQLKQIIRAFTGLRGVHVPFEMEGATRMSFQELKLDSTWKPSKELAKNIRKAEAENAEFIESVPWEDFFSFMQQNHPYAWPSVQQKTMHNLFLKSVERGSGKIAGVKMKGQWAAMQFYICQDSRAYLIQNAVASDWRKREPMPFLLNQLFGTWMLQAAYVKVNFMGSNNAGVARFNEKFGATSGSYWELR
jgi:hypothetical protein